MDMITILAGVVFQTAEVRESICDIVNLPGNVISVGKPTAINTKISAEYVFKGFATDSI